MRLLTIGSVSPMNGGDTQGGVATQHSMINQEFVFKDELGIEVVGTIATNSKLDKDPKTGVKYYCCESDETVKSCLERVIILTQPDMILVRHITNAWAAALSKIEKLPLCVGYVHSVNALEPTLNPNHLSKKRLMLQALEVMDLLIFNSPHSLKRAKKLGLETNCMVKIIPPSARWEFNNKNIEDQQTKEKILFVGRLDKNKRVLDVIESFSHYPMYELIVVGDGPLKQNVIEKVKSYPNQNLTHHDNLNSIELVTELMDSSILCVPSEYESFGLVYVEALCMGVPVIGFQSSIEFINSCLGIDCGVPIKESVQSSIEQALVKRNNQDWNREVLSKKAREFFNPYRHAKEMSEVFHKLKQNMI